MDTGVDGQQDFFYVHAPRITPDPERKTRGIYHRRTWAGKNAAVEVAAILSHGRSDSAEGIALRS